MPASDSDAIIGPADHFGPGAHAIEKPDQCGDPKRIPAVAKVPRRFELPIRSTWRVETGFQEGMEVTPYYDPMIAKVVAHESSREDALRSLKELLSGVRIEGVKTNIPFLLAALGDERFVAGQVHTGLSSEIRLA